MPAVSLAIGFIGRFIVCLNYVLAIMIEDRIEIFVCFGAGELKQIDCCRATCPLMVVLRKFRVHDPEGGILAKCQANPERATVR